ncbi:hypothetical protein AB0I81_10480 [Nonomuraea sp. NPDC050404]|uniref:hypothetical protein n=1 Tax=Nonomuraea sp. NPDC050404 TaxID=3155783 RepID=UPI0033C84F91
MQIIVAHRLGINNWTARTGPFDEYIDWDHVVTRATWYPAVATLIASAIASRLSRRAQESSLWLPVAAWLGACLSAVPLLYGLAVTAPEEAINHSPAGVAWATVTGGVVGLVAAIVAQKHRQVGIGLLSYALWVSLLEFTRPLWWDRPPPFDPFLSETVSSDTGAYVVEAIFTEAGGLTAGLAGPVLVSGIVAVLVTARSGRWGTGVLSGTAGPLLLFTVYLTFDAGLGDQESRQAALWGIALLGVLIGLVASMVAATAVRCVARLRGAMLVGSGA